MRTATVTAYLAAQYAMLAPRLRDTPALGPFLQVLKGVTPNQINRTEGGTERPSHRAFASDAILARALRQIPETSPLRAHLHAVLDHLDWFAVFHGPQAPADISHKMHMAPLSWQPTGDAPTGHHTGLFVLHPDLDYPAHTHAADEVYLCLSGQLTIRHGVSEPPITLSPGMASITPSERLHSLHTGSEPVILAYVWHGELGAPNWWWHRDASGDWMREQWQWEDNDDWRSYGVEPVSPSIMARCCP
ncbi:MAG: dimethylsulfonioproprionate lyase family protein [Roseovarius sp.]